MDQIDTLDRISNLAEFIMHHILSFLPFKDAARTSVLSRKWNSVWASFPILDFCDRMFWLDVEPSVLPEIFEKLGRIVDGKLRSLHKQKLQMQMFRLYMTLGDLKFASFIDKWIILALANDVRDIDLEVDTYGNLSRYVKDREVIRYRLPEIIFGANSVYGCNLDRPYYALQKLRLARLQVTEQLIEDFIRSCPMIEFLAIRDCSGLKSIKISRLPKLETVEVSGRPDELERVDIEVPSLQSFYFRSSWTDCGHSTINLTMCQGLRKLRLWFSNIKDELFNFYICKFPLLENLTVSYCNMLERVTIKALSLKSFSLYLCNKLVEVEIDAPNLTSFKYDGSIKPFIISKNIPCQWEITVRLHREDRVDTFWFHKLREFLHNSNQKVLSVGIPSEEVQFDLEELRDTSLSPVYELEYLKLDLDMLSRRSLACYATFLDGLFWCCRPKIVSSVSVSSGLRYKIRNHCIKIVFEKLLESDNPHCCSSSLMKCWKHYLKGSNIESFEGIEDGSLLNPNTLLDALYTLEQNQEIRFRLEW